MAVDAGRSHRPPRSPAGFGLVLAACLALTYLVPARLATAVPLAATQPSPGPGVGPGESDSQAVEDGAALLSVTSPGAPTPPSVSAAAAILVDWRTGQVLFAKDAYRPRAPASTTKILTGILVLENASLAEKVKVSRYAAYTPGSDMPVREGQVLTVGELLWGILLHSANDACVAVAEHIAGSEQAFVGMMNRRAAELGAWKTHFRNPHGISVSSHFTTPYDLALLARYALTLPVFDTIVRTREATLLGDGGEWELRLRNTNQLLWSFAGADGVKTGTTDVAGRCLVASASRDGRRLISVVLNAGDRYQDSAVLLDWGFRNFTTVRLARAGRPIATVRVKGGLDRVAKVTLEDDLWVACPTWAADTLGLYLHFTEPVKAPLRRGQVAGVAEATLGEGVVRAVNLVTTDDVLLWTPERGLLKGVVALVRVLGRLGVG